MTQQEPQTPPAETHAPAQQPAEPETAAAPHPYLTPIAVVLAGILIASAIYFGGGAAAPQPNAPQNGSQNLVAGPEVIEALRPVDGSDHVRGNPEAAVTVIEYSDFECPFCAQFHPTLDRIVREYEGKVRWVYRHLPLTSIHPEAHPAAVASECAAELGGNEAFWAFSDGVFENQSRMGADLYRELAAVAGIDQAAFAECTESGRHDARIEADVQNAIDTGGRGTPHVIVLGADGGVYLIPGALPYEQVKEVVDKALGRS